jgi:hypothetical protein
LAKARETCIHPRLGTDGFLDAQGWFAMGSAELERLGFSGVARRTNAAVAVAWIAIWIAVTAATRALTGEWYGLGWGFVLGGALAGVGTWLFYARPVRRRRIAATLEWGGASISVLDGVGAPLARIALAERHRALLVRAKAEGTALLRIEQSAKGEPGALRGAPPVRLELFGPLPAVLPMRIVGEARTLRALEARGRARRVDGGTAYRLGAPDAVASEQLTALMAFLEEHRAARDDEVVVPFEGGALRLAGDRVVLEVGGTTLAFEGADEPSLRTAVETAARALPLGDGSVESFVAAHALRRVLLRRLPDHPLLETLRR